jgi:hypothetical protein
MEVKTIMTAAAERVLLARADELADTAGLAGEITEIIGRARAARVDPAALAGLVTAVRLLGGDVTALFRAVRGRHRDGGRFGCDTELLEAADETGASITARARAAGALRGQAGEALRQARADAEAAGHALARAQAMPVADPCRGCHPARDCAIEAARHDLAGAREREDLAGAALEVLAPLPRTLTAALRAVRRLPGDLHDTYAAAYDLVTADPRAMPADGDFITGTAAAMATAMLAARIPGLAG